MSDDSNARERFGNPSPEALAAFCSKGYEVFGDEFDLSNPESFDRKAGEAPLQPQEAIADLPTLDVDLQSTFIRAFCILGSAEFAKLVDAHRALLDDACRTDEVLKGIIVTGLQLGVQRNCAECANQLGALYYTGQIVEQDYEAAQELYQLAMGLGNTQAAINLGYMYEYGRAAEKDYSKAYMCYSFAAAIDDTPEALYKMGDMFSRGYLFERDEESAFRLWSKSLDVSTALGDLENQAQAAIRLAPFYMPGNGLGASLGIDPDPLYALRLYQVAEVGLRISINNGLMYYEKRLSEALDGQEAARRALAVL